MKDLARRIKLLTISPVKLKRKFGFFYARKAQGVFNFAYMRPFFCGAQLPIIYPKFSIRKGLGYIKLSGLMPHIDSERGLYEAFSL